VAVILLAAIDSSASQNAMGPNASDSCHLIADRMRQAQCYETLKQIGGQSSKQSILPHGWKLIGSPDSGRREHSISHTGDFQSSDPNFAGMMLRCVDNRIEVLLIVIEPYPPQAAIDLTIKLGNSSESTYRSSVVPPGLMVLLPSEAAAIITGSRRPADELRVDLTDGTAPRTKGMVKLLGLEQAIGMLKSLCATP